MSTCLTGCYSFRLFYFVLCGDFNFVPSYSMVETNYNILFGIIGSVIASVFGGGSLMWLICPTHSMICLPYYLKFLTLWCLWVVDLFMIWPGLLSVIIHFLCLYVVLLHSLFL